MQRFPMRASICEGRIAETDCKWSCPCFRRKQQKLLMQCFTKKADFWEAWFEWNDCNWPNPVLSERSEIENRWQVKCKGLQLNSTAFVANARPGQARQTRLWPSSSRKPLGHAFLFAEQGNRVWIPDTERRLSYYLHPANLKPQGCRAEFLK